MSSRPLAVIAGIFFLATACAPQAADQTTTQAATRAIRVMTFNAWGGGANDGTGPGQTLAAIRAANADFIGLQEVRAEGSECSAQDCPAEGPSFAKIAAEALGYHLVEQHGEPWLVWAQAILSRHPPVAVNSRGLGAIYDIDGLRVALFNLHFTDYPYQPYQAAGIPYGEAPFLSTSEDLIAAARDARGEALDLFVSELEFTVDADLVLVTGDFNEPSHRDWSEAAALAGRHPLAVHYPTIGALEQLGFVDGYRAAYPDEMAHPGFTWTPTKALDDPHEHHDRIDYVLLRGRGARVTGAWIVGESKDTSDILIDPWPSDHRAVVVEIEVGPIRAAGRN